MTDKLTLSDCFKYPNAKVIPADIGKWSGWIKSIDIEHKMLVVSLKGFYPEVHMDVHIADCKLILRDISELTGEEKKYINDNFVYELFKDALGENNYNSFDELFAVCDNKVELINYLRSKNIMIEPEDWFKQGKAVKDV
jgi:hypothetical protein